ncbi:hypothetical protein ACQPW1_22445 [Nocardia sp. CA-128927]|uniref:hypothetical protein n=1 Tax=Nocardia sp. CA-128927 TaxID=3239975 RepID=UPI003D99F38E
MTEPNEAWTALPPWNVRLLGRIHQLAVQRTQIHRDGYQNHDGGIEAWRTHLGELDMLRRDTEKQAASIGIPQTLIREAADQGEQGAQWSGKDHRPDVAPATWFSREEAIDELAHTVWNLEHMAALSVARRERLSVKGTASEPDSGGAARFQRNMTALWVRARGLTEGLQITDDERHGLWITDAAQWRQLVADTVHTYDDYTLDLIWGDHTNPAIEANAVQLINPRGPDEYLSPDQQTELPPTPHQMLQHATQALGAHTWDSAGAGDQHIGPAIEATLPTETAAEWTTDPETELWQQTPGNDAGPEP